MGVLPLISLGFISLLLQTTVVRDLLTVFSGNELDIGITLSLWLASVGAGSLFGGYRPCAGGRAPLGASFIAVAFFSAPTVLAINLIRPALSLGPGEAASLSETFLVTAAVLFPLCFSLGIQFPIAVSASESPPSRVYGLEALGAFAGGVFFTYVLSGRLDSAGTALAVGIACIVIAAYILRKKAVLLLAALPLIVHVGAGAIKKNGFAGELVRTEQSRYGEIWVTRLEDQYNVYSSGRMLYSYPDPQVEELRVHLSMSVHPLPEDVLQVGGSPEAVREFLKYPVKAVHFVELDPKLLDISVGLLGDEDSRAAKDARVRMAAEDGRKFVKALKLPSYDLIVLNLPEPTTANSNRFYTVEFFREAAAALKKGGMLALSLPTSGGYVGRRTMQANGSIYNSLREVFDHVEVTTEEYGFFLASDSPVVIRPAVLAERFEKRAISTAHFRSYIFHDAFMLLRTSSLKSSLGEVKDPNTDLRPVSYLYNLMLWAEVHGGRLLSGIIGMKGYAAVLVFVFFAAGAIKSSGKRRPTLYYSVLTTGYAGMAFSLAIMLGYQSAYGYIYERVGMLGALFMAGAAAGTRPGTRGKRGLIFLEAASSAFALVLPLFFLNELLFHMFALTAGIVSGFGFKAVSRLEGDASSGGRLYALDLAGSFAGAFLTAIILIPVLGIRGSLYIVAGAKCLSAMLVLRMKDE